MKQIEQKRRSFDQQRRRIYYVAGLFGMLTILSLRHFPTASFWRYCGTISPISFLTRPVTTSGFC
jgi:hypothetical protein